MSASIAAASAAKDVSDLHGRVGPDRLSSVIAQNLIPWSPTPLDPITNISVVEAEPDNAKPSAGLSIRSIDELLSQALDDADVILEDRILAEGQSLVVAGPGGIGKSFIVGQGMCALASGQPWLAFNNHAEPLVVLNLQCENSQRRLHQDLARFRDSMSTAHWDLVRQNLRILSPQTDNDHFLNLDNPETCKRIADSIAEINPDVVVMDPLYAFGAGDLNNDSEMRNTCQLISALVKRGNPNRAVIIVHHSLTGKAGAARAVGYDRASFGRNSKLLYAWTRAQINIAPGSPDSNDVLVVVCGKNSNGPEFVPFAIRRNPATMLFERDLNFDLEGWRSEISGHGATAPSFSAVAVADLVRTSTTPPSKPALVKLIMAESGCQKSQAYKLITQAETRRLIARDAITKTYGSE